MQVCSEEGFGKWVDVRKPVFFPGNGDEILFPEDFIGNCIFQSGPLGKGGAIVFPKEIIGKVVSLCVPVKVSGSLDEVAFPKDFHGRHGKIYSSQT